MLYLIGLGLSSPKDITIRGLEAIKESTRVYLESYTSILLDIGFSANDDSGKMGTGIEQLEELYGKKIIVADREMVECDSDAILKDADTQDIAFCIVGDPFGATTHIDLLTRATDLQIPYTVIHNASIMNGVGATGISLYNYGQTISIPFFTDTWRPSSWMDRLKENLDMGLHTLCLLDIKVKEQSEMNLARGRKIYEPPRYMTCTRAIQQILSLCAEDETDKALEPKALLAITISALGSPRQKFVAGTLESLARIEEEELGGPLMSLVILGRRCMGEEIEWCKRWCPNEEAVKEWDIIANGPAYLGRK